MLENLSLISGATYCTKFTHASSELKKEMHCGLILQNTRVINNGNIIEFMFCNTITSVYNFSALIYNPSASIYNFNVPVYNVSTLIYNASCPVYNS